MEKPVAFVDVDDVVADTRFIIEDILCKEFNITTSWMDWHSFDLAKSVGIKFDSDLFKQHNLIERVMPSPESGKFLFNLSKTHKVVMVTARGWHDRGYDLTEKWFKDHNLYYDKLEVLPLDVSKKVIADKYKTLDLVIDDNADHIKDYLKIENLSNVYLVDRPWNQHLMINDKRFSRVFELPKLQNISNKTKILTTNLSL